MPMRGTDPHFPSTFESGRSTVCRFAAASEGRSCPSGAETELRQDYIRSQSTRRCIRVGSRTVELLTLTARTHCIVHKVGGHRDFQDTCRINRCVCRLCR